MNLHGEHLVLPNDEHNQALVANVHPSNWVNPEPTGRYNIVVIGAGTAGLITAVIAASLGAKVALIERGSEVGGGDHRSRIATVARIVQCGQFPDGRPPALREGSVPCRHARQAHIQHFAA